MDKLKTTNNGGMPFDLDDLRWIDKGVRDTFKAIGNAMADSETDGVVLWGCDVTDAGGSYNIASGAIYAANEIWLVDAHSVVKLAGAGSWYIKKVITYDPTGNETFENSATVDTYEIRRLRWTNTDIDGVAGSNPDFVNVGFNVLSPQKFSDVFVLKTSFDQLQTDFNTLQTDATKSGFLNFDFSGIGESLVDWETAISQLGMTTNQRGSLAKGIGQIKIPALSVLEITFLTDFSAGYDVIALSIPSFSGYSKPDLTITNYPIAYDPTNDKPTVVLVNNQNIERTASVYVKSKFSFGISVKQLA